MPSTENQNISIEDFMKYIADYLSPKQVAKVQKAYDFAARVHADQKRRSGEPTSFTRPRWPISWRR